MTEGILIGIEWEPQFTFLNWPKHSVYIKNTKSRKGKVYPEPDQTILVKLEPCYQRVTVEVPPSFHVGRSTNVASNNWDANNQYQYTSIDGTNFEVITKPVKIEKLPSEIMKADKHLKDFCIKLVKLSGPLGVFLPNWEYGFGIPSKHINISLDNVTLDMKSDRRFMKSRIGWNDKGFVSKLDIKGECRLHQSRIHITVPYNFNDYSGLLDFFKQSRINKSDIMTYIYKWSVKHPMPVIPGTKKHAIFLGYIKNNEYIKLNGLV